MLYRGVSKTLPSQATVDKKGRIHTESVKSISSHLIRAREKGARIFFVGAKHTAGRLALYDALNGTGVLGKGFAVFDLGMLALSNDFIATGQQQVNGIVHMSVDQLGECKAATCPHTACGSACASTAREMNQAHDAVLTLATALAPLFRYGGRSYLAGAEKIRTTAMAAIRATSLGADVAASGLLEFSPGSTKRGKWNFGCVLSLRLILFSVLCLFYCCTLCDRLKGVFHFTYLTQLFVASMIFDTARRYTIWNIQGSPPINVDVGRVQKDGFEPGAATIMWPGGTTKLPQDTLRGDPPNLSIGWVVESAWATPALRQESRMYAQQAIDEINDNLFILPNTHLTLEVDERVHGNDKTVEAHNAIEARAKAAGRPLCAVLAMSSSHMSSIYAPKANVTVTQRSSGVPIVGYYTGAGELSDSKRFPNFIRLYPPVSETQHVYRKVAFQFGWTRIGLLCDKNDAYSLSFFDLLNGTDPSNPNNLQPPPNAAGHNAQRLAIAHAEVIDLDNDTDDTKDALIAAIKAKDVKVVIVLGQTTFVENILQYGIDRGTFMGFQVRRKDEGKRAAFCVVRVDGLIGCARVCVCVCVLNDPMHLLIGGNLSVSLSSPSSLSLFTCISPPPHPRSLPQVPFSRTPCHQCPGPRWMVC